MQTAALEYDSKEQGTCQYGAALLQAAATFPGPNEQRQHGRVHVEAVVCTAHCRLCTVGNKQHCRLLRVRVSCRVMCLVLHAGRLQPARFTMSCWQQPWAAHHAAAASAAAAPSPNQPQASCPGCTTFRAHLTSPPMRSTSSEYSLVGSSCVVQPSSWLQGVGLRPGADSACTESQWHHGVQVLTLGCKYCGRSTASLTRLGVLPLQGLHECFCAGAAVCAGHLRHQRHLAGPAELDAAAAGVRGQQPGGSAVDEVGPGCMQHSN